MSTVSVTLNQVQIKELISIFNRDEFSTPPAYALYQVRTERCVITIYESKKVVFQGKDAEVFASKYTTITPSGTQANSLPQCGSDEVGTGDYFGPVCVVACAIDESIKDKIAHLNIQDSKQINDAIILKMGKQLISIVPYSICILTNEKYNLVHDTNNMNAIKAKLHNQCYINLQSKIKKLPKLKIVDQFTTPTSYYNYLKDEPLVIGDITFETKADSKFISVACASIIARYIFLQEWEKMEQEYSFTFPKGASSAVDNAACFFIEKYGLDELNKVAKMHFKNTSKAQAK